MAFTTDPSTRNYLALTWGVEAFVVEHVDTTDDMVKIVDREMLKLSDYTDGDTVIITAGSPPGVSGTTNLVRVHHLGN